MRLLKHIFSVLSWIVFAVIIAYVLIAAPMVAGYKPVVVLSGSMEPAYNVGSVIYYKSTPFEQIKEGDAITFKAGEDALVTHRVTTKNEISRTFVTKGDANPSEDANPVDAANVIGRASELSIPYAGYFISYGKQLPVIIAMAAVIIISIILDSLYPKKKRETERAEQENEEKQ